tara:strand:+ start:317 stop:799 length:483 start_codon:yes stop_codon:yes gene_type:complete
MSGPIFQIVGSVLGGLAQIRQAQAQQVQYEIKARNEMINARTDALNYKKEGIEKLVELNRAMASTVARAASGNLDPYAASETKDLININSMRLASVDLRTLELNQEMAILRGNSNAQSARLAGDAAVRYATASAMANVATNTGDVMTTSGQTFSQIVGVV